MFSGDHDAAVLQPFFAEKLTHNERVLDVGCGTRAVAYSMVEAGALVTGVAIDRKNCKRILIRLLKMHYVLYFTRNVK